MTKRPYGHLHANSEAEDGVTADHLRLQPGQEALTPEQEAEARRFAQERIAAQLSTEPVDEPEAEHLLRQAYMVAGLPPPERIHWVDGPLPLVVALAPQQIEAGIGDREWESAYESIWDSVRDSVEVRVGDRAEASIKASVEDRVEANVWDTVGNSVWDSVYEGAQANVRKSMRDSVWDSVRAYEDAPVLAFYRFFDRYLAPNALRALAQFNELVSGYWLGTEQAALVRRPRVLSRDAEGRLHSATGKCIDYPDGWGFYAWHGVRVAERVILTPEALTRQDFLNESNVEVRRVIQERMGERFVSELGGVVIDTSPRGTLYEVRLPADDPERVARYVQVQDVSTERRYFLRVAPTIQTAAEAVAWTFQVAGADYRPTQET